MLSSCSTSVFVVDVVLERRRRVDLILTQECDSDRSLVGVGGVGAAGEGGEGGEGEQEDEEDALECAAKRACRRRISASFSSSSCCIRFSRRPGTGGLFCKILDWVSQNLENYR